MISSSRLVTKSSGMCFEMVMISAFCFVFQVATVENVVFTG